MLISEVGPIDEKGINLLEETNPDKLIDTIIEEPLREACKTLARKGIETVMSSANKNNICEYPKEKEDIYDPKKIFFNNATFEDAGIGYAWIMINFDTLSDDNKDLLFSLEEKTGINGEKIGERAIWFVHPFEIGNLDYKVKIGEYSQEFIEMLFKGEIPESIKNMKVDERLVKFEKKHIVIEYNYTQTNTVIIRMPINGKTRVDEVEQYFVKFAETFKIQEQEKNVMDRDL